MDGVSLLHMAGLNAQASPKSPTTDLVVVLVKIFSAIILGYVCMRNRLIVVADGETKGLQFFLGNIAFPLLIFDTVATAQLGSIDFGVILACSLAKLVVYWGTWIITFFIFKPFESRGQRVLTATVFSFFSIAGDDFATGFPVINALYGSSMTVYIAANSLVGSFVFVPMTLILFQVGKGLRQRAEACDEEHRPRGVQVLGSIVRNILTNPVIIMTVCGLIFQLLCGQWLVLDSTGTKLQMPEPLASIIALWTGPFAMMALLSTGLSLTSAKLKFWPMVLVLLKLMVCAYLSYLFGLCFVYKEPMKKLHDFTFFYGSVPTSSAPLLFAAAFDPSVVEIIASAVLFGYILAGPNMFVTALFLSKEDVDMTTTLRNVQSIAGVLGAVCGGLCICWVILIKKISAPSGPLLAFYSAIVLLYGLVDYILGRNCDRMDRYGLWFIFNFLQLMCTFIVLYFQVLLASRFSIRWHSRVIPCSIVILVAAVLAYVTHPVALDQLCHQTPDWWVRISTVISRLVLGAIISGLVIWTIFTRSRRRPDTDDAEALRAEALREALREEERRHPLGIIQTLCVAQAVRILAQVVNSIDFLTNSTGSGVSGGRVQVVIIEQVLEVGQGIVLFIATLLQQWDSARLEAIFSRCGRCFTCGVTKSRVECEITNTFIDPGDSIAAAPDRTFLRQISGGNEGFAASFRSRAAMEGTPKSGTGTFRRSFSDVELPEESEVIPRLG